MRTQKYSWLSGIAYVASVQLLIRLIGFLLEVPSAPLDFREGGKAMAGWILLYSISCLALEALLHLWRRWRKPPGPVPAFDPYLMAVAELEKEREEQGAVFGRKSA